MHGVRHVLWLRVLWSWEVRVNHRGADESDGGGRWPRGRVGWRYGAARVGRANAFNGGDSGEVAGEATVEGVAAALKARADGGAGTRGGPPAAWLRQAFASGVGFGRSADSAKQDGAIGVGAVAFADPQGRRGSHSDRVGGG